MPGSVTTEIPAFAGVTGKRGDISWTHVKYNELIKLCELSDSYSGFSGNHKGHKGFHNDHRGMEMLFLGELCAFIVCLVVILPASQVTTKGTKGFHNGHRGMEILLLGELCAFIVCLVVILPASQVTTKGTKDFTMVTEVWKCCSLVNSVPSLWT